MTFKTAYLVLITETDKTLHTVPHVFTDIESVDVYCLHSTHKERFTEDAEFMYVPVIVEEDTVTETWALDVFGHAVSFLWGGA